MQHSSLPDFVSKYFWGDNLSELSLERNETYIIQTILNIGDQKAVSWLLSAIDKNKIKQRISLLKLTTPSSKFWNLFLS
ncbi:hypothetical protein COY14_02730 [Candidatus Roizmanbacteria bacterium CG_4_10_14_0_2_um_filter_36_9]|uniref:DUF6922 domain-containing protein n=1 Tax=Candidatus Roizmanbacteria bacterium CG_4_10_14_0_2_um_filter_36_9 TaxID=1974823 RepID=A0A2M7U3V0_9BACT|nr:MAG: hypothetical protein COY14_02730 [Candidatus Roizmanbacteria bacterium CG_4_10_14_0_2_um_filter_36_9]